MLSEDEGRRSGNLPEVEALRVALVQLKEEKDLSLTVLARDSHISRSTWNRVLKGESFPPRKEIERLSRKPRFEAQHLMGLWEAADAAIKQAAGASAPAAASPATADVDDKATAPTAPAAAPPVPDSDSSLTAVAPAASSHRPGDALRTAATGPAPAGPVPSASPPGRPDTTTAEGPAPVVPVPAADAESIPTGPPAGTSSPPPAADVKATGGHAAAGSKVDAVRPAPAPAPAAEEIGVVRPVPVPAPATKTGKAAKLLITLLALTVVLLIGRWAAMPDPDKNDTAAPQATGETLPGDIENPGEGGDAGDEEPPQDAAQPSGGPATAGSNDKPQDLPTADPGDSRSPEPGPSSGAENTTPPAGQAPQKEAPSSAPTTAPQTATTPPTPERTTVPPTAPTTAASLGEEGRTACAHYKPNRRVILAKGMVGTNVAQVQCLLNHNYDYNLAEDGKFGADTEAGVKAIQRCSGITADGKVGPATWKYLDYPKPACGH